MVCGSTAGIGRATALEMAALGAEVCLVGRTEEKLTALLQELDASANQKHHYIIADFSEPETLKKALGTLEIDTNPYHILVNNTGGPPGGTAKDAALDEYIAAFQAHLICNQILQQALTPGMQKLGYGRIINVISTSVKAPLKGLGVSNTIRGAVANWAKTLSFELAADGITVNNVLPGATATGRLESIIKNRAGKLSKDEAEVEAAMKAEVPAGRFAQPEETAYAICFLASESAGYINGINLPVDGGRTPNL